MNIGGKCGLVSEHIVDRKNKGANLIEFHTDINDFVDKSVVDYKNIKETLIKENVLCHTVHSPMKNTYGLQCSLSEIDPIKRKENFDLLLKSVEYANYLCEVENPIVVIHPSDSFSVKHDDFLYSNIEENNKIFKDELNKLSEIVKTRYPNIRLGLENTMPFVRDLKTNDVIIHTGFIYPSYMKDIDEMNLSNVGHVLDICHALATIRFTQLISGGKTDLSLNDYLEASIKNLFLIHLNNAKNMAESPYNHGTPYCSNVKTDMSILKEIITFLKKNDYKNYITIEVMEDNYFNAINYKITSDAINKIIINE